MLKSRSQAPKHGSKQHADSPARRQPDGQSATAPASSFLSWAWPWLSLVGLAAVVYSNSLNAPFLFDDVPCIVENVSIRKLADLPTVLRSLGDGNTVQGRPLLNFTLAVNYALHGAWPPGFRLANIVLHAMSGLLVFALVRETLRYGRNTEPLRPEATLIAFAAAAIWTIHPLNTESVTYIIQRAESLVAFWLLLTLTLFALWIRLGRPALLIGAILSSLAGMASKEVMITAPFVALLYDRTFAAKSWKELFAKRWLAHAMLWLTTGLLLWILSSNSGNRGTTAGFGMGISPWNFFLTSIDACATYLKLAFWPSPLIFDYGTDFVKDPTTIVPQAILVFGAAISGLAIGWWRPWIGFLTLVFAATLAPASSFIPVITQTRAEHRTYLPLIALVIFVVVTVAAATRKWANPRAKVVALAAVLLVLGVLTLSRNYDYRDELSIWQDTATKRPQNDRALYGAIYALRLTPGVTKAEIDRMIEERLRELVTQRPHSSYLNTKLGDKLVERKAYTDALACFTAALNGDAPHPQHYAARSNIYLLQERYELALAEIDQAIDRSPLREEALLNSKGVILRKLGKISESIPVFDQALRQAPTFALAFSNRAGSYADLGKFREAYRDFERAIELKPDSAEIRDSYAAALANDGRIDSALAQADLAVRLAPEDVGIRCRRGRILRGLGRPEEAIADFGRAIEVDPTSQQAFEGRAVARFELHDFAGCLADLKEFEKLGGTPLEEMVQEANKELAAQAAPPNR